MYTLLTAQQMREVDAYMINQMHIPSIILMENAALGVCDRIKKQASKGTVHVFCGTGNNGGDGLAVARILLSYGYDVHVILLGDSSRMTDDTAVNFQMFRKMPQHVINVQNSEELARVKLPKADVVVDAIFGTGLSRDVEGMYLESIRFMNRIQALKVAVDIPSGIHADTGECLGEAMQADYTVTFQYPKPGHYLHPGKEYTGTLDVVRIGVDEGSPVVADAHLSVYNTGGQALALPSRPADSNKGDYGNLLVIAGSDNMTGAAVLCTQAASRAGAGLVTLASTHTTVGVLKMKAPEAMSRTLSSEEGQLDRRSVFDIGRVIKDKTAVAIGPGLGTGMNIQEVVEHVIENYSIPMVIDADAINVLAGEQKKILRKATADIILTPHPKEFARLIDADTATILNDPIQHARTFAMEYGVVLVLKGATTVVASPEGKIGLISGGSPGMAKGGSGDVLTGIIGGLLAQNDKDAYESALLGAYIAAEAGEYAAAAKGEHSTLPSDTINYIGKSMEENTVHQKMLPAVRKTKRPRRQERVRPKPAKREVTKDVDAALVEKTAEQALAEIEEKEKTQEIKQEIQDATAKADKKSDKPTRRRIG